MNDKTNSIQITMTTKSLLFLPLLLSSLLSTAQTMITSRQTGIAHNELTMNVVGTMDGRPFRHTLRYNVTGLDEPQRDSLFEQGYRALAILVPGIKPPTRVSGKEDIAPAETSTVTVNCETCTRKGELLLYGQDFLATRKVNDNRPGAMRFPLTVPLAAGNYRLVYKQRGRQPIELSYTLNPREQKQLTLK